MIHIEAIREYCLAKKAVTESFPFDNETLVLKVADKMFALVNLKGELRINLKCDSEKAVLLREQYPKVQPGYHMNKKHWNSIYIEGSIPDKLIKQWIDESYELVVKKMPKRKQNELLS